MIICMRICSNNLSYSLNKLLSEATVPEHVFPECKNLDDIASAFREYSRFLHPDVHHTPKAKKQAEEGFKLLGRWRELAEAKMGRGTFGNLNSIDPVKLSTNTNHYTITERIAEGSLASVYYATDKVGKPVAVKIVRDARNSDLMANEAKVLATLHTATKAPLDKLLAHIPDLVTSFEIKTAGKGARRVNVLRHYQGYTTWADIIKARPGGIDLADAAWMFRRLLAALIGAHQQGIVHGAVLPDNIIIRTDDVPGDSEESHNGVLLDWCYSVKVGQVIKAIDGKQKERYPEEVLSKLQATPAIDVYMAMLCLVELVCGSIGMVKLHNHIPSSMPLAMRHIVRACLLLSRDKRIQNAMRLYEDFDEVLNGLYGKKRFREFKLNSK